MYLWGKCVQTLDVTLVRSCLKNEQRKELEEKFVDEFQKVKKLSGDINKRLFTTSRFCGYKTNPQLWSIVLQLLS